MTQQFACAYHLGFLVRTRQWVWAQLIWYLLHCAMFLKVQQRWLHLSYRASFIWACIPITIHEHYIVYRPQKEAYLKTLSALEAAIRLYGLMFKHLISSTELKEAEVTLRKMWASSLACTKVPCTKAPKHCFVREKRDKSYTEWGSMEKEERKEKMASLLRASAIWNL